MRCFLCIEIKKPEIISQILQFQEELKPINARIKFVEAENLHFTLKFLGNIETSLIDEIYSVMKNTPFSAFSMTLEKVGFFTAARPRVIWIGISKGREKLAAITSFLNQNLKDLGFKPEKRKFSPHITIGRIKYLNDRELLNKLVEKWRDQIFGKLEISAFQLKESVLTPKGPVYSILKEINE